MSTGSSPVVVFHITEQGRCLGEIIAKRYSDAVVSRFSAQDVSPHWKKGERLIFIMASGIVVRTIAPLLRDKRSDPAVLVLDEKGRHVVSLVGGHIAGANQLAREVARITGGEAIITTASDVNDLPAIDLWAEEQGLAIENREALAKTGTKLANDGRLRIYSDVPFPALPSAFSSEANIDDADIVVTYEAQKVAFLPGTLVLRPRGLVVGVGCNSSTRSEEIDDAIKTTVSRAHLSFLSLAAVATIDMKAKEPGLVAFCEAHALPLLTYSAQQLNRVTGVTPSPAARKATGAQAVAEPAAILASQGGKLVVAKQKIGNVTVAVALKKEVLRNADNDHERKTEQERHGTICVVGTGPGRADYLTPRASDVIRGADAIVGYGPYLDLVRDLIADKEIVSTGMAQEIDRCARAIELAAQGKKVAVISGGDPGIYAMAGLVLELLRKQPDSKTLSAEDIEIVPGVSALNACAARLGAPLMHDFAAISLSDRLTPWETITARIEAAAREDFVIVLYNPKSRGRRTHIEKARSIIMAHRSPETPVGIVKAAMREDEAVTISDLAHMPFDLIDMQTTVIIGNSKTETWNGMMITPRGYEKKEAWKSRHKPDSETR